MGTTSDTITVCFNGSCPVCRREIDQYKRLAERSGAEITWVDVTADRAFAARHGLDFEASIRRLHTIDANGKVIAGVPAFAALFSRIPALSWIGRALAWPVIRPVSELVYERILAPVLYAWNKRRLARAEKRSAQ